MNKIKASQLFFSEDIPKIKDQDLEIFLGNSCYVVTSSEGSLWAWGHNYFDKLGYSSYPDDYERLPKLLKYTHLDNHEFIMKAEFGSDHNGYLSNFGNLSFNGKNEFYQLGQARDGNFLMDVRNQFNLIDNEKIINIHLSDYRSAALTNKGRMFYWGVNDPGIGFYRLSVSKMLDSDKKNVKITEITEKLDLKTGEEITHFQLVNSTQIAMILITNHKNLYEINVQGKNQINSLFPVRGNFVVREFLSYRGTHALLTDENQIFCWGKEFMDKEQEFKTPQLISTDSLNEKIIKLKISYQFLIFLSENHRLFFWGKDENKSLVPQRDQIYFDIPVDITDCFDLKPEEYIKKIACNDDKIGITTSKNRILIWGNNCLDEVSLPFIA